jgi:hypothetical protein
MGNKLAVRVSTASCQAIARGLELGIEVNILFKLKYTPGADIENLNPRSFLIIK